jgi:hypothetical protein
MPPSSGNTLCSYPNTEIRRSLRRIEARNLHVILLGSRADFEAIGEQRMRALKAEEERRLLLRIEYSGEFEDSYERTD